eukprot:s1809_g4.t1
MDAVFAAGKFKGRWYSDVAGSETAFCSWAKKQKSPPGYLRPFLDFLKNGRRGQQSLDALVVRSAKPRTQEVRAETTDLRSDGGIRFDFTMDIEDATGAVPHLMREALAHRPDVRVAAKANHWRFGAQSYVDVLRWLERGKWSENHEK